MIVVLAAGVRGLTRLFSGDGIWFFAITVSSTVLAWGCARNGQSTLLITGMMLLAAVDVGESRWWRAATLLALAFAFKPLVIVLILLVGAIYPQMSWRLGIGLFVVAIAPFAAQRPEYALSQYVACLESLKVTFDVGESENWAQLFGMLSVAGVEVPSTARNVVRLIAAAATLLLCWKAARHLSPQKSAFYIFALSVCYLMLFNSRTEGNTYTMVGPVYGALMAEAGYRLNNKRVAWWMIAAVVLSVLNFELAILFTSRQNAIWVCPMVCVGVTSYLIVRLFQEIRNTPVIRGDAADRLESSRATVERSAAA